MRGLKFNIKDEFDPENKTSHPSRGAWIEILETVVDLLQWIRRTPRGVRGLKSQFIVILIMNYLSHPSRGAWIEIVREVVQANTYNVAPLAGCVD